VRTSLVAVLLGFLVALVLTPWVRNLALRKNVVDDPRDGRRMHARPIPRVGGLALAAGALAPILGLAVWENQISEMIYADARRMIALVVGAGGALLVGLADDLFRPPARWRLLALVALASFAWLGGHRVGIIELPLVGVLDLGAFSAPVTVLWIVGVIVAFNFIDGLDGLAAGIALIASVTLFVIAYLEANVLWMTWTGSIVGALLGFLVFNFNPASVFMGDSGSNFLGFLMAVVALETNRKETTATALFVPALLLGLPILDAALTMVRRALLREGMFLSERGHLHHRLLDLGLSHRRVVLALWGVAAVLALGGLVLVTGVPTAQLTVAVAATAVLFALMAATGYLRPEDVRTMWRRGLENRKRDAALGALTEQIRADLPPEAARSMRVAVALSRLTGEGGISGAEYRRGERGPLTVGEFDAESKGVRAVYPLAGGQSEITFLWKGRTSGPTRREDVALQQLVEAIDRSEADA
jgi:UDP-GlcNAc:undecaprenyl-phosphate GlcNAc-1-phosphate transferase